MNLRSALLAATVLALPLAAKAQPINGLYIGAGAGYNILSNEKINLPNSPGLAGVAGSGASLNFQGGFVGKASIGWGFGNGLRAEVEGNFLSNKAHQASFLGPGTSAGGFEYKAGGLVNAIYDFTTLSPYFQPYIGAGVGYEAVKWNNVRAYSPTYSINTTTNTKGSFAYQGILGVAYPIAAIPGFAITTEFDYLGLTGNREYSGSASCTACASGKPATGTGSVTSNSNHNYSFLLGVRYAFGVAPPPPPPVVAPAPAPARSYLVFFDWDKYNLTDRARAIIKEAAVNSTKVQYTKIQVNGYTDTSGSPKYNMGLSIRRAEAVAAELVKDGVPKAAIAIQGFGQTHLLVPTADGVREPQNRRVEIIIQ
jgi:outer membrane protein OmpA-like peptidoglycan-associated protein